jgi:hypothetical protein
MDKASVIEFDDDISAFNGIVAVTTRDDLLPFHTVRTREDEEGPPFARLAQAKWIIVSRCFATLSRGLISFALTGQLPLSYAMEPRYRLVASTRAVTKGLRTSTDGVRAAVRRPRAGLSTLPDRGQHGGRRHSLGMPTSSSAAPSRGRSRTMSA